MKKIFLAAAILLCCAAATAQTRVTQNFNSNWNFKLDSVNDYSSATSFSGWRNLNLPHDWSVELPFDKTSPTGTGGGALRGGMGWYSKIFTVPATDKGKQISILFEGVYCRSTVYLNGKKIGYRPSGYISFSYDITPYLQYDKPNTLVVKVNNNQQPNSRWYSGSGIYRNVWLIKTNNTHIETWGTYVTTPEVSKEKATVRIETTLAAAPQKNDNVLFATKIVDAKNNVVATAAAKAASITAQEIIINKPQLWSLENPYLYKAITTVTQNGKTVDEYTTSFGIRYFKFDAENGFFLNGKYVKIRGVCNHHDLGCLGTAFNLRAAERQIEILKSMGCNAIRTSHNPPAPGLLDLCDKHGMLVMDEAFDMWEKEKNPFDYHLEFNEWSKIDLETQIKRDRNHPSVIIWSMGNEIYEQWWKDGEARSEEILKELHETIMNLDKTRPTVTANNFTDARNRLLKPGIAELVGYNYHQEQWSDVLKKWPGKPFIVTESVSALQTRGHYDMPSDSIRRWPVRWDKPLTEGNPDTTCSAYENCSAPWGSTHEETIKVFEKEKHIAGMFIWTGFDYIGEPTPYDWPARSSYFGIMDLAGFPKDCYYLYKSIWTNEPVLHVFPHWNEQPGLHGWKKGDSVDVWVYYSKADKVELFVNGKSMGVKQKQNDDLHIMWRVQYEPGSIKAVSTKNGKTVLTEQINTAGPAYKIELVADHKTIKANGEDLSFVTINVLDKNNNLVPDASNLVQFEISGSGFIAGVDNGSETSMESFKDNKRKAFNGKALVVLQNNGKKGDIILKATAAGLQGAAVVIKAE